ncbi:MAG: hypothetical protein AAF412_12955, partial [Pseudomonadota bacterium]
MDSLEERRSRAARSNVNPPLRETGSQTAGPYVHIGCLPNMAGIEGVYPEDLKLNRQPQNTDRITIRGQVFEGNSTTCKDILSACQNSNNNNNNNNNNKN